MIIIPMAGNSSRFYKAGYLRPKYELPVGDQSLFSLCVRSFERYFRTEQFVFVCRQGFDAEAFIEEECTKLNLSEYLVVSLKEPTRGQAESVQLGLEHAKPHGAESLLIFNIDTARPGYEFPLIADAADGYLEVFRGEGENWSFVKPAASFSLRVAEATEKKRISDLCCTGLYHFARADDFTAVCTDAVRDYERYSRDWKELYIAPLYNVLIQSGKRIVYHEVAREQVLFSGTPEEYQALTEMLSP